jgi:hypothetical protein
MTLTLTPADTLRLMSALAFAGFTGTGIVEGVEWLHQENRRLLKENREMKRELLEALAIIERLKAGASQP